PVGDLSGCANASHVALSVFVDVNAQLAVLAFTEGLYGVDAQGAAGRHGALCLGTNSTLGRVLGVFGGVVDVDDGGVVLGEGLEDLLREGGGVLVAVEVEALQGHGGVEAVEDHELGRVLGEVFGQVDAGGQVGVEGFVGA